MPEVLEVELTRRAAEALVGRRFVAVERTDPLVIGPGVDESIVDATIEGFDRRGKVLAMLTDGPTVGLHFGMTGRLLLDETPIALERLEYWSHGDDATWDRWVVRLDDGGRLRFHDPRRLGRVWLEPDLDVLGPDALSLTRRQLGAALQRRRAPVKAVLLDQAAVAGLGNMLVDEVLWWAGIDPHRPAATLSPDEVTALHKVIRRRLPVMLRHGGSHTGSLSPTRRAGGVCPATAASCVAMWSAGGRPSGAPPTSAEPGMIRADVSGAPPLLGSTGSTTIALAALLVVVGIAMICTAVWLVRATRTDSRSLGPLEVMGDRGWRRRDADARSRTLDAARPDGAPPPAPILPADPDDPPPMTTLPAELAASEEMAAEVEAAAEAEAARRLTTDAVPESDEVVDGDGDAVDGSTDDSGVDDTRVDEPQPAEHA